MKVGVIIGRFQIDSLHDGHKSLMAYVREKHERVLVFLGCAPIIGTKRDPLDYPTRLKMINHAFPEAVVLPLPDNPSDEVWSENVDRQILLAFPKASDVTIYGGRHSFIPHYHGRFKTKDVDNEVESKCSASERRKLCGEMIPTTPDERRGVIYAIENRWGGVKPCVDVAMTKVHEGATWILCGKKDGEKLWRLPGGMVDATDASLEAAAARELTEETGLGTSGGTRDFKYIGSFLVDDWRFRKVEETKLMTSLFHVPYFSGAPQGGDDLAVADWVMLDTRLEQFHPNHRMLIARVREYLDERVTWQAEIEDEHLTETTMKEKVAELGPDGNSRPAKKKGKK